MADLSLYFIFQSHMVLQREKPIIIWGTGEDDSHITVNLSDMTAETICVQGKWQVTLPPHNAGRNYTLTVSSNIPSQTPVILKDIAIGDIWLAGGQSNMEFFLKYDKDWEKVKQYKKNPDIHMFNIPQTAYPGHHRNIPGYGYWMQEDDASFETFSAPAYSFARNIQPHIQVPVGIIGCNWGGTTATSWIDEKELEKEPLSIYLKEYQDAIRPYSSEELSDISLRAWEFEDSAQHGKDFEPLIYGRDRAWQETYMKQHKHDPVIPMGPYHINRPGGLFHLMLEPLIPFAIKGVLWYQGETDAGHADIYDILLGTLIQSWRRLWKDDFPFLFVQLAPFGKWLDCTSDGYTTVRDKQYHVSKTVPNTAMASIMDIGSYYDIHPKEKMEVGRRLSLLARNKVYGEKILCESPEIASCTKNGEEIILSFSYASTLTITQDRNDFLLIQNDTKIPIQSVRAEKNQIFLTAPELQDTSCMLSLGWADYAEIHIHNEAGLPIKPFCIVF